MNERVHFPDLYPMQLSILNSPARFKVVSAGRRMGKTRMCSVFALKETLQDKSVMWVAPTYKVAEVGWRTIEWMAKQVPGAQTSNKTVTRRKGMLQVRSADSDAGLRGEGLDLLVVDECAHIRGFSDVWEQELRPALSDRKGKAIFISTPKGFNHFADLFNMQREYPEWKSWQAPTSSNPFIDPAEIEQAKKQLPALVFRQEYEAEFVQLQGAMFKREMMRFADNAPQLQQTIRHWDIAATTKTQSDYSVGCKGGLDADGNVYVTDVVRGRWEWPALIRVISDTAKSDGESVIQSVETAGTQRGLLDLLQAEQSLANIAFKGVTPQADKITRANPVLARAEQGKLYLVRANWNQAFIDELCAFPESEHDDQVDALSGMLSSVAQDSWLIS